MSSRGWVGLRQSRRQAAQSRPPQLGEAEEDARQRSRARPQNLCCFDGQAGRTRLGGADDKRGVGFDTICRGAFLSALRSWRETRAKVAHDELFTRVGEA